MISSERGFQIAEALANLMNKMFTKPTVNMNSGGLIKLLCVLACTDFIENKLEYNIAKRCAEPFLDLFRKTPVAH